MTIVFGLSDSRNLDVIFVYFKCCIRVRGYYDTICLSHIPLHHVQYLSSGGGAEVLPVLSSDGFEADNSINFLGRSILFHNLISFTL